MASVARLWSDTHGEFSVVGLAPSAVATGARVLLVGDPAQPEAVDAGGASP